MSVSWGGDARCIFTLPTVLPPDSLTHALKLRCQMVAATDQALPEPEALTGQRTPMENPSS
jgi:hypothetical protein